MSEYILVVSNKGKKFTLCRRQGGRTSVYNEQAVIVDPSTAEKMLAMANATSDAKPESRLRGVGR